MANSQGNKTRFQSITAEHNQKCKKGHFPPGGTSHSPQEVRHSGIIFLIQWLSVVTNRRDECYQMHPVPVYWRRSRCSWASTIDLHFLTIMSWLKRILCHIKILLQKWALTEEHHFATSPTSVHVFAMLDLSFSFPHEIHKNIYTMFCNNNNICKVIWQTANKVTIQGLLSLSLKA